MTVRIGELSHRVTITEPGGAVDAMGQEILTFGNAGTRWAKVDEVAAPEEQVYDGTKAKRRIVVTMRSPYVGSKLWNGKLRLSWNGIVFDVVSTRALTPNQTWVELIAEALE
jgi:head-tail adaptor